SGTVPPRQGNAHLQIVPYQLFATADTWVVLAVGNDGQWQRFCQAAERPDLGTDDRFTTNTLRVDNRDALVPLPGARPNGRGRWAGRRGGRAGLSAARVPVSAATLAAPATPPAMGPHPDAGLRAALGVGTGRRVVLRRAGEVLPCRGNSCRKEWP